MDHLFKTTILGLFFGTFGTTIGGIVGVSFKRCSNKFLSFVLSLASGLMTAIVCFELIPEALEISNFYGVLCGIIAGVMLMIFCDIIVDKKFKYMKTNDKKGRLLKTGIVVGIGLAIHNFPEGLAIGSGFEASISLGYSLAIAIALHDVPEGISMAVPMKNGGMDRWKVLLCVIISGITTGVGAFFGALVGGISQNVISLCLAFAAGAMLYIVSGELIPESNKLFSGRFQAIGNIIGFVLGMLSINL